MAKKDAELVIGADASAVERAAAVAKAAWRDAGQAITSAMGSAAQSVATDLANVALAQGKVNFSAQHAQVREFEAATARLAVASGRDLETVRAGYEATGAAIGKRPGEVAAWSNEVGKLTYNFKGAGEAIKGISGLAAETGRGVEEYKGLAVVLGTVGHVAGDTTHAIGVMQAQSEALGMQGGIAAFAGQVEGLRDVISHFAVKSESDFLRVTGAAAALGKGLNPQAAARVQQAALSYVSGNAIRIERYLGHRITDEHGQVADPGTALEELRNKVRRQYGDKAQNNLSMMLGSTEAGAALMKADFRKTIGFGNLIGGSATGSLKADEAQKAINATDAGKRAIADAELAESSRALLGSSTLLGKAADALQQFAAHNPITSTLVATALGTGASGFMSTFGKSLATLMGGKGGGGAVGGVVDVATKGTGALGTIGRFGLIGAAAAGGLGVGALAGHGLNKLDDKYDISGQGALEKNLLATADEAIRQAKVVRDQARAARAAHGAATSAPAGATGEAAAHHDLNALAREIADALSKVKIEVTSAPETPIAAAMKSGHGRAAGSQKHG